MRLGLLVSLRERQWTQKELAHKTNLGEAEISKIIRGHLNPTLAQKKRIAKALGCAEAEIFKTGANNEIG